MKEKRDEIIILRTTKAEKNRIYEKMLSMGIGIAAESSEQGTAISLAFHINCLIHEVQG